MHQTSVSTFLAIICQALRSFVFSSVSPRTTYTHLVVSLPTSVHVSDNARSPSTFQWQRYVFGWCRQRYVFAQEGKRWYRCGGSLEWLLIASTICLRSRKQTSVLLLDWLVMASMMRRTTVSLLRNSVDSSVQTLRAVFCVSLVNSKCEWRASRWCESSYQTQYIQWRMSISGNVNVFQQNRKWFFFRHVQFDSGFHVMAVYEVSWNRPKIISCFTIISRWVSMWGWTRESVWFSLKNFLFFSSVWAIPDQGGCSQTLISSKNFNCSICDWEDVFTTHGR